MGGRYAHRMHIAAAEDLWQMHVFNAFRRLLAFCPLDPSVMRRLSVAQAGWSRALLGWEPTLPGIAATGDLRWLQIAMAALDVRCSLLARLKGRPPTAVSSRVAVHHGCRRPPGHELDPPE